MNIKRIYYLDWLRVIAFWLLILFHSWQPFTSFEWIINTHKSSILADVLSVFFHTWRLHLIFFISGVGTWFALKKARNMFIKNRFQRLIIPYVVSAILIIPVQHYFEALQDQETTLKFLGFIAIYLTHLLVDHNYMFNISKWNSGVGIHLWYLTFLFTMTLVFFPVLKYLKSPTPRYKIVSFFEKKPNRLFLLALPIIISRLLLKPIFPAYTGLADFITYSWSFLFGYTLISNHEKLIKLIQHHHKKLLLMGVLSSLGLLVGFVVSERLLRAGIKPSYDIYHLILSLLIGSSAFAWTFFWVSFFSKNVNKNHQILKIVNESVLPIYIIHQSIIVCVGFYITTWDIPSILQFLVIVISTVFFSVGFFKITAITNTTRFLVGMKKKKL